MTRTTALAALLALGGLVAPCRAADPVAETEKFLRDDEKSLLAALRTRKAEAAEFDADSKFALADAQLRKLFLDKWRGKVAAFAQVDEKHPDPNLEGKYRNYAEMLSPEIRAYLERRIPTMKEKDRNALIEYLESVNESLADDQKLSWYTKKVVSGIFDKYRGELTTYLATPLAQDGLRNGPAAAKALAAARAEAEKPKETVTPPARTPTKKKQPGGPIPGDRIPEQTETGKGTVAGPETSSDEAKRQLEEAAKNGQIAAGSGTTEGAGENLNGSYDGGVKTGDTIPVPVGELGGNGSAAPALEPANGAGATPALTAEVPPPPAEESFMDRIKKLKTGKGETSEPMYKYTPHAIGLVVGAAIGIAAGPIGIIVGGLLGLFLGAFVAKKLFR